MRLLIVPIVLVLAGTIPSAFAQYSDWNLTVYPVNVNWGDCSITITVKGPYGWEQTQTVSNGPSPYATFVVSGNDVPSGTQYRVCISSNIIGLFLPNCQYFTASVVNISPS